MREPDPFFGGQVTIDVFGPAAQKIAVAYNSPYDFALGQPVKDEIKRRRPRQEPGQGLE